MFRMHEFDVKTCSNAGRAANPSTTTKLTGTKQLFTVYFTSEKDQPLHKGQTACPQTWLLFRGSTVVKICSCLSLSCSSVHCGSSYKSCSSAKKVCIQRRVWLRSLEMQPSNFRNWCNHEVQVVVAAYQV